MKKNLKETKLLSPFADLKTIKSISSPIENGLRYNHFNYKFDQYKQKKKQFYRFSKIQKELQSKIKIQRVLNLLSFKLREKKINHCTLFLKSIDRSR